MDSTSVAFGIGDRVRVKRPWARGLGDDGAELGTVVGLPPAPGGQKGVPPGLFGVLLDGGEIHGFAPELLELSAACEAENDLEIAAQRLRDKREGLFHDMLCIVAASRRADLSDPLIKQQIEAEVRRLSASWGHADAAALRRREFAEAPELRKRLIGSLTKYLEAGDLLDQLAELIDGDSS